MTYKEFEEKVKEWGEKYNYNVVVEKNISDGNIGIMLKDKPCCIVHKLERFVMDLMWIAYKELPENERNDLFQIVTEFSATKIKDREDEKKFIIPLPGLVTTDGRQQYLSQESQYNHKDCKFFASRRDKTLRQIWKEKHLKHVPEIYRQFAVEFDEEKEI